MSLWSLQGQKILIIDDIPDMRTLLRDMCVSLAADDITTASNGDQAIQHLLIKSFDIVFCDYNLGDGKDGQQTLEEAQWRALLPRQTLFIMVTAENTTPMVMAAIEHAPDDYWSKPIPRALFQERLRKLMDKKTALAPVYQALDAKRNRQAVAQCDRLMEQQPALRHELLKLKGDVLLEMGEYASAQALFEAVLHIRDLPWASLGLGKALFCQQRYEDAAQVLRDLTVAQPMLVAAYDWLAQSLNKLDQAEAAQTALAQAAERSPKSLLRQRQLGELAYGNGDYAAAQKAYKMAVRVGKNSCLRDSSEFVGLAMTQIQEGNSLDAIKTMEALNRELADAPNTPVAAALVEALVYRQRGQLDAARHAIAKALQAAPEALNQLPLQQTTALAGLCFEFEQADAAGELLHNALMRRGDDPASQRHVLAVYEQAGLAEQGQQALKRARREVAEINRHGIRLAQEGQVEASIHYFEDAARSWPENVAINLNAAQSLIVWMREHGIDKAAYRKAEHYLENVRRLDQSNDKYGKLKDLLNRLTPVGNV